MTDLQKELLEILKAFIKVCEDNNLTYYLCAGTCLGAVRHKGFIPWDDDVDVILPREDFDKFIQLQDAFEDKKYFIQTYKTDKHYTYNYAKVRDSSTTYIENFYVNHRINHGVWIDVYPLDGVSYKKEDPKKHKNKVGRSWKFAFLNYLPALRRKFRKDTWLKDLGLNIVGCLFFFLNIGHINNKHVDKQCKKIPYKDAAMVGNLFGLYKEREIHDASIFMEGTKGIFEGIEVNLPKDYDTYLKDMYHDYMKLPPLEKQVGHHIDKGFSLEEDYQTYMKKHHI
ncbi:MAG: LicD family protein [Bacilli bacterium]|nr:LicD family protein [Bacilli bacterium]